VAAVAAESRPTHADFEVLANFEMQVRIINPMRRSDSADLLATRHALAITNQHRIEMPVKSIDRFQISFLAECVADDDDVAPAEMHIAREHHHTIADAVNRIAQIAVAAADAVPIFAEMTVGPVAACL